MTIADEITRIKNAKNPIREAIAEKYVEVPETEKLSDYYKYVEQIETAPPSVFAQIKQALKDGSAATKFPVGMEIKDEWHDTADGKTYNMPLIVVHYGDVKLEDGTIKQGAYLMRKQALPFAVQYDAKTNRYVHSGIHKYLNANADKNVWWNSSYDGDTAPTIASTKDGYLKGCSDDLLAVLATVKVDTAIDTVSSGGVTDSVSAKFFLPSREQLHAIPGAANAAPAGTEGDAWDYFKSAAAPSDSDRTVRAFKDANNEPRRCWIRSAVRNTTKNAFMTTVNGAMASYPVDNSTTTTATCVPACVIV